MSQLVPMGNSFGSDLLLPRSHRKALGQMQGRGVIDRAFDVEQGRKAANRMDVHAAVGAHAMERADEIVRYGRDLAAGDAAIELALMPFQQAAFRGMLREQSRLFNPLG